jgi:ferritin-like metal-binding protein YciE
MRSSEADRWPDRPVGNADGQRCASTAVPLSSIPQRRHVKVLNRGREIRAGGERSEWYPLPIFGLEIVSAGGDPLAKDAALIAAAQRVEHYEIAGYGTASTLADQLGLDDARDVLDQTLDEESNADKLLTKIAAGGMFRTGINEQAAR